MFLNVYGDNYSCNIFVDILVFWKKLQLFSKIYCGHFWKQYWATFYSIIWSHWRSMTLRIHFISFRRRFWLAGIFLYHWDETKQPLLAVCLNLNAEITDFLALTKSCHIHKGIFISCGPVNGAVYKKPVVSMTRFGEIPPLWPIFKNLWQLI